MPSVPFNITLSPLSPLVQGILTDPSPWACSFSKVTDIVTPGLIGNGDATCSAKAGGSITTVFVGTGVRFVGSVHASVQAAMKGEDNIDMGVTLDGSAVQPQVASRDHIASAAQLPLNQHNVTITPLRTFPGLDDWTINQIVVSTELISNASTTDDIYTTIHPFVIGGKMNPAFTFSRTTGKPGWEINNTIGGIGNEKPVAYEQVITSHPLDTVILHPPPSTSFFDLKGTVGPAYDTMQINISPTPPHVKRETAINTKKTWIGLDQILFFAPLDPTVQYNITISRTGTTPAPIGLRSVSFYSADRNSTTGSPAASSAAAKSAKLNVGAIAGGIIGGVVGLAVLIALAVLLVCRRKRRRDLHHRAVYAGSGAAISTTQTHSTVSEKYLSSSLSVPQASPGPGLTAYSSRGSTACLLDRPPSFQRPVSASLTPSSHSAAALDTSDADRMSATSKTSVKRLSATSFISGVYEQPSPAAGYSTDQLNVPSPSPLRAGRAMTPRLVIPSSAVAVPMYTPEIQSANADVGQAF